jgi:MoaA/NifB/PqqE/SkfB family radical SAM enzyme
MIGGVWRRSAKDLLRRVLPERLHGPVLAIYRKTRDRRPSGEDVRRFYLRNPVPLLGRYPGFSYPRVLSICLTTRCNLRCFICRREDFKGRDVDFASLARLADAFRHAATIDLTGWGECFLYPRLEEVLSYIYSLNGKDRLIQITSNGTLVSRRSADLLAGHIERVTFSLNAASAAVYRRETKQGDFSKTMRNIQSFASALGEEDRRRINFHFVAHTGNFREIPDFVRLARDTGVSSVTIGNYLVGIPEHCQFALINDRREYNAVLRDADLLASALGVSLSARRFFETAPSTGAACNDPYDACFVEVDGQVGPCCFCGSYRIGNAFESGFEPIWFGERYRRLRQTRDLPGCRSCSPFVAFDDPGAHFTAYLKEHRDLREIEGMVGAVPSEAGPR